jgi:hypothetical protein
LDRDGLNNRGELLAGSNPLEVDTDGDGWWDEAEVTAESDPRDPLSRPFIMSATRSPLQITLPGLGSEAGLRNVTVSLGLLC